MRIPSAVVGRQCPALSPAKKMPSSTDVAQLVRDPVALVAVQRAADVAGQATVGRLTPIRGSNDPTPTRTSSPAGNDHE